MSHVSRLLVWILLIGLLLAALPGQPALAYPPGPYHGEGPDYEMFLMPIDWPEDGAPNPNANRYIRRNRSPDPIEYLGKLDAEDVIQAAIGSLPVNESIAVNSPATETACLDFDDAGNWGSVSDGYSIYDDQFGGWGVFVVDIGEFYQAESVVFTRERSVTQDGPYSFKMYSAIPYAAGMGSPIIPAKVGEPITVSVRYLIRDWGSNHEWVSLGIKGDATAECSATDSPRCYVNGRIYGEWAELTHTVQATSEQAMVLIHVENPAYGPSEVYFDNLRIQVGETELPQCRLDEDLD